MDVGLGNKHAKHLIVISLDAFSEDNWEAGFNIKKGFSLGPVEMVDIAPTMAKVLGLDFYRCDGRVLVEMLK